MGGSGTLRGAHRAGPTFDGADSGPAAEDSLRGSTLSDSDEGEGEGDGDEVAAEALRFERGATIDRYMILDRIGAGAMGVVYTAYDPRLDRRVALKVMHARPGAQASDVATRLLREAQALAKLSHPNVVAVHDANALGEVVYLTMELVDGVSLTRWLKQRPRSVDETLKVFIEAGQGLAGAHAAGLIHRDFKPDNVLVGDDGRVRVVDFGIARGADGPDLMSVDQAIERSQDPAARSLVGAPVEQANAVPAAATPEPGAEKPGEGAVLAFASTDRGAVPGFARSNDLADTQRAEAGQLTRRSEGRPGNKALVIAAAAAAAGTGGERPRLHASQLETAIPGLSSVRLTRTGALVGTPAYMAPEQHIAARVDARTDQFAFCIALYEALFGSHPFPAKNYVQLSLSVLGGKVDAMVGRSDVPVRVRKAILRGLSVDPDQRFASMDELIGALRADPELRRRRRVAVALLAGGVAGVLALAGAQVFGGAPPCEGADRHMVEVYNDAARDDIRAAFLATEQPYAPKVLESSLAGLDRWSQEWSGMRREACEATHVHHEQSADLLERRIACLDRKLRSLSAMVAVLRVADKDVVLHAVQSVDALPELAECEDRERLTRGDAPSEQKKPIIAAAEVKLAQAEAARLAVQYDNAERLAGEALAVARSEGLARVEVQALTVLGRVAKNQGRIGVAEQSFTEAGLIAERVGADELRLTADGELGVVLGVLSQQHAEAERTLRHAEALLDRVGATPHERVRLRERLGMVLAQRGQTAEARDLLSLALSEAEALPGDGGTGLVSILNARGTVHDQRGESAAALADFGRALAICEAHLSPDHPDVAAILSNMAIIELNGGQYERARERFERALKIHRLVLGDDHPITGSTHMNLGTLLQQMEDYDGAAAQYEQALAVATKAGGSDADLADILYNLGAVYQLRKEYERALTPYRDALARSERVHGPDHAEVAYPLFGLGGVLVELGRYAEGRELLERALAIRTRKDVVPVDIGELRFALARAVAPVDRDRAHALAIQARSDYSDAADADSVQRINTWLKGQLKRAP
ncbi:serine/threonine-protein kinase [Nannocystis sp.]|uniref:serine/threonine-protein kinase n=1 Tax=Nannocystis sp. TaxID=1962667 RepID=UPI0025DB400F|nr:serine/threonine-protein kinase [Nannocystis sp.]MBK7826715.1 serine/threonine protein kinase [Nannocystis sp.]